MTMLPATQARIDKLLLVIGPRSTAKRANLKLAIEKMLREQDRDTRHACAEAVLALWKPPLFPSTEASEAHCAGHQACMNAIAI
jgi:hypothetical protein